VSSHPLIRLVKQAQKLPEGNPQPEGKGETNDCILILSYFYVTLCSVRALPDEA